ncbi:hypothetical protein SUGI_0288780 [Cryptomeria japonica]|nr:hypothetical protein SUGI_0288780 [Cryptomeria japonica]
MKKFMWLLCFLAFAATVSPVVSSMNDAASLQTYIIHTFESEIPSSFDNEEQWHSSLVQSLDAHQEIDGSQHILYNYDQVIHGFAAQLTTAQAEALKKKEGVLAVHPEGVYRLHTTRTPHFLGLDAKNGAWHTQFSNTHQVIVGMVDTGIWPESPSFSDNGFEALPLSSGWKGKCEAGTAFNASHCNKKLIGARFFCKGYEASRGPVNEAEEYRSPRDQDGHGTHTASTALGSFVQNANFSGFAPGTAAGMAPSARLAVYKVCWAGGCMDSDVLAGVDRAVKDGVHILSLSIGRSENAAYDTDAIALAAFSAMQRGVFVSASAGNSGPERATVSNVAPWITTVGAGSIDRAFPASLVLGNGVHHSGVSLYTGKPLAMGEEFPLIYAPPGTLRSNLCLDDTLDPPAVGNATARILSQGAVTVVKTKPAPMVAAFSSRGPNSLTPQILKPDIIAPGVDILAAWTDPNFRIVSGTSMACPHVTGIAALIKAAHPEWSPAAIRSALMTTAYTQDNTAKPLRDAVTQAESSPFVHGAGHLNPNKALTPGLVYDMGLRDYIQFLCSLNYTPQQMRTLTRSNTTCPINARLHKDPGNINYPSFSLVFTKSNSTQVLKYQRSVTNVGDGPAKYRVTVSAPPGDGVSIAVTPSMLSFKKSMEKRSYTVSFTSTNRAASSSGSGSYGSITWTDGIHLVRSPVAFTWQ